MRWSWKIWAAVLIGLLLSSAPTGFAQKPSMPPPKSSAPMRPAQPPPAAAPGQQRVVVIEPVRVYDPFFAYPDPYAYPQDYMDANFGYVKLKTDMKDATVYVDGGYADKIAKVKKFAIRPGTHDIEVRDKEGVSIFKQRIAVLVGKTTELKVG